jgi:protein-S-isoprenylcysteine O-methyltransferase Ste14
VSPEPISLLARFRVPLGFAAAAVAFFLARPSWTSWRLGLVIALVGELVRLWASGHIEKGREITRSGPYRFVRHPLYLGSALLGFGFIVAANDTAVAVLTVLYLGFTLTAAARLEEAHLDEKFAGAYSDYRAGAMTPADRPYSWGRVLANREYQAVAGLAAAFVVLWWKL